MPRKQFFQTILIIFSFTISLCSRILAESADSTLYKIKMHNEEIKRASMLLDINPSILKAVIYTERTMNYDWEDETFDNILAHAGLNSSLGFCQVKLKTAYWIERQVNDSKSTFYPGDKYKGILRVSKSPEEIISKLNSDSKNILYAAAYIKIMLLRWSKSGFSIDDRPEIIGTLYFAGLFTRQGEEREPRQNPLASRYGLMVKENILLFR
ncbi:MAG: hypothetical protein ACM3UR_12525 [Bacteroidota bacterium]|jgi:hypothetical protein|nr:hypothetical protein [Ignavibacteria bacterium]MCU7498497.1 hypothetical protein [Ignavibacteria bacterium]MCU7512605.1 hypothetical protein [Ignavibacteria bacterium]MCU7521213.1 hypothetical protein [Ignavibacteria bacterium]MCU7525063.1 hypothetical protein [Ignavibacteria bacterium]